MTPSTRQRRSICAAVVCLLLTACSGGSDDPTVQPSASPTASKTTDKAAAAVQLAVTKTSALKSYAFRATQSLTGGPQAQSTVVQGRVVRRPAATSYVVKVGTKVQDIVQVNGRTFRRVPPGPWRQLVKPLALQDPLASLLVLLNSITQPTLTGSELRGTVTAEAVARAKLAPSGAAPGAPAPLTLSLSPDGHVTALTLQVVVRSGSTTLQLKESTAFSGFDAAAAVTAPIRPR